MELLWVVVFQLLCVGAIIAEILVPSFGVLTVMAIIALGGSYFQLYQYDPSMIPLLLLVNLVSIPGTLLVAVKLLGKSPIALRSKLGSKGVFHERYPLGTAGLAVTDLRPAGKVEINGEMVDVLSTGEYIEKGSAVEVVYIGNSGIKVSEVREILN